MIEFFSFLLFFSVLFLLIYFFVVIRGLFMSSVIVYSKNKAGLRTSVSIPDYLWLAYVRLNGSREDCAQENVKYRISLGENSRDVQRFIFNLVVRPSICDPDFRQVDIEDL